MKSPLGHTKNVIDDFILNWYHQSRGKKFIVEAGKYIVSYCNIFV